MSALDETPLESAADWVRDHVARYLETDGEDGHDWKGAPTLLLTTLGRRSGKPRRIALIYGRDGDNYVLVASRGGAPKHPLWYENLVAHPEVRVQVGGDRFAACARTATGEERERLWKTMTAHWPLYDEYQTLTEREIPVVVLEPLG